MQTWRTWRSISSNSIDARRSAFKSEFNRLSKSRASAMQARRLPWVEPFLLSLVMLPVTLLDLQNSGEVIQDYIKLQPWMNLSLTAPGVQDSRFSSFNILPLPSSKQTCAKPAHSGAMCVSWSDRKVIWFTKLGYPLKDLKKMPAGKVFKNNPSQILVLQFLRIKFYGVPLNC